MEHTPGPWTMGNIRPGDKEIIIEEPSVSVDYDDVDHKEQEANAQLIAAAPELLEACKEASIVLKDEQIVPITSIKKTYNKLQQAITKAQLNTK